MFNVKKFHLRSRHYPVSLTYMLGSPIAKSNIPLIRIELDLFTTVLMMSQSQVTCFCPFQVTKNWEFGIKVPYRCMSRLVP